MSTQERLQHVELLHRFATELQDLQSGAFDTIVLNSVVQYFPDIEYLLEVIRQAVRLLKRGGHLFIGDVRHLGLLSMFHSAVQLSKAAATVNAEQLRRRIARAVAQEKELVIDPQLFALLPGQLPGIAAAKVQMKRGLAPNELTRYRYDVVLRIDDEVEAQPAYLPAQWQPHLAPIEQLEALSSARASAARFTAIPNGRLAREVAGQKLIETSDSATEASTLRRRLGELALDEVDPEIFCSWGEPHGYDVSITWDTTGSPERFDVTMVDRARAAEVAHPGQRAPAPITSWSAYANNPLENGLRQQLVPQLRAYLEERLPEFMNPSAWMVLRQLPLTANGKVDRRALPAPQSRPEEMGEYVAPRTDLERALAEIWAEVLRVDQVGVHDNFFEIGGHSLLATRVVTHISHVLDIDLPLRSIFDKPTIEALSDCVVQEIAAEVAMEES
jgi:acyl carrier protein